MRFEPGDNLVIFDVVSLYTSIPIKEALDVIFLLTNPDMAKLAEISLTSTFFYFQGEFYEQTYGVSMVSPLSPIVANLFMEDFESKDLSSALFKPKLWRRFIEDTCTIWQHKPEKLHPFFQHLNNQSKSI